MIFDEEVFYLGTTEKEYNGEKYKVIGFIDTDTMKTYTCSFDDTHLDEFLKLPAKSDAFIRFRLDKGISGNKEVIRLKALEVLG